MPEQYEWKCADCNSSHIALVEPPADYTCSDCQNNKGGALLTLKTMIDGQVSTEREPKRIRLSKKTEDFIRQDCPLPQINSFFQGYHLDSIEPLKRVTVVIEHNNQILEFGKTLDEQGVKEGDSLISSSS